VKNLNAYAWAHPGGSALVPEDNRGRHQSRPNRLPALVVAQIDKHIASFPRESSHYSLNTNKKCLRSELGSVRKMHLLSLELYEPALLPRSDGEDAGATKPQVTYEFYNERFKTFDLAVPTLYWTSIAQYCTHVSTVSTVSTVGVVRQTGR
jgi:hypothetical protein